MVRLITEISILATALLGLYKVARFSKPSSAKSPRKAPENPGAWGRVLAHFEPAIQFASVYAFILIPILFFVGFNWLMGTVMEGPHRHR